MIHKPDYIAIINLIYGWKGESILTLIAFLPILYVLGQNITEPGAYWQTQGFGTQPWPQCGEIDIMEHWGNNQNYVQSAMHTPSSSGATINHGGQYSANASRMFKFIFKFSTIN